MEYISEAFEEAFDLIAYNSVIPVVSTILFVALTIYIRKTDDRGRRKLGNVMLGFSVPDMLVVFGNIVLFVLSFARGYSNLKASNGFSAQENDNMRLIGYNSDSVGLILLDLPVILIMGIAAMVIGIIILKKDLGKPAGVLCIILGLTYSIFSVMIFGPLIGGISY